MPLMLLVSRLVCYMEVVMRLEHAVSIACDETENDV